MRASDVSGKNSVELGTAVFGVIGTLILIALVYGVTVMQFRGSPGDAVGSPEAVAERIKPVGKVVVAGAGAAVPVAAAPAAAPAPAAAAGGVGPGEAVYNRACFVCHAAGVAGAPKLGDKAAWEPRLGQGIDGLLHSAVNGKNAMPPRGTCADCSDADLRAAIEYMISSVK